MPNQTNKLVTTSALLLLLGSTATFAGRGDIDSAFGMDGRLEAPDAVMSMPDDRFVSCAPAERGFVVRRFDADGHLDETFGQGGEIVVPLPAGATPSMGACQFVTVRGGMLFAGYLTGANRIVEVVLRIDGNGRLDTSFGGHGDGIYRLTDAPLQIDGWFNTTMAAITVDASGRVLYADRECNFCSCGAGSSVVRLTSNGVRDATFGSNGRAELPSVFNLCSTAVLLGARDDGSVVVGTRGLLTALDANGALDASFGEGGLVTEGVPDSDEWLGRLLPNGSILIIGSRRDSMSTDSELRMFDRHGRLDSSFGGGTGVVSLALGTAFTGDAGAHVSAGNFVVEPDGSHLYVQLSVVRDDNTLACPSGIARLAMDGIPDATFGKHGLTCLDYGAFSFWLMAAQSNGAPVFHQVGNDGTGLFRLLVGATPSRGMLTLVLTNSWAHVRESDGYATVAVARVAGRDGAVGARYSTGYPPFTDVLYTDGGGGGTGLATAEKDYRAVSGLVDWADGDDSWRTVNVPILNDDIAENRDIFGIFISEPRGGVLVNGGATNVEIADDDASVAQPSPPTDPTSANPPPSASGGGGGGGALSWVTLVGLLGLLGVRRARAASTCCSTAPD